MMCLDVAIHIFILLGFTEQPWSMGCGVYFLIFLKKYIEPLLKILLYSFLYEKINLLVCKVA